MPYHREKVVSPRAFFQLLVNVRGDVRRKNLEQSGGSKLTHAVVLDGTSGKIGISHEGKLIDGFDEFAHVFFVVRRVDDFFECVELGGVYLTVPFQLVFSLVDHFAKVRTFVHPTHEAAIEATGSNLECVGSETNEVKISLQISQDHLFPDNLLIF